VYRYKYIQSIKKQTGGSLGDWRKEDTNRELNHVAPLFLHELVMSLYMLIPFFKNLFVYLKYYTILEVK
jgi:hypothetical protein